jgi:mannobiose 2-epimerase
MAATERTTKVPRKTTKVVEPSAEATTELSYETILGEIETELHRNLNLWLPRTIDDKGGFFQEFDQEWKRPKKDDVRFAVFQARMTWLASVGISLEPKRKKDFISYAQHGLSFLGGRQWDADRSGFYDFVQRDGKPFTESYGEVKSLYCTSFGIYALAAMYRATSDLFALDLAFEAFEWIDAFAHDDLNGGYYNVLAFDGKQIAPYSKEAADETKTPGIKTMNTHIHLLESFTELLRAAPHIVLRERTEELLKIVRDKIATPEGYLIEILTEDWQPISKVTSFGHDVETAFLLLDSAEALGMAGDPQTVKVARALVDRALKFGWNEKLGSLADASDLKGKVTDPHTKWWASAEALNAFLLMHELFGSETDVYWKAFVAQWGFIKGHHIDEANGGWYEKLDATRKPTNLNKGSTWKEAYHETRAMMHVAGRLKRLAAK